MGKIVNAVISVMLVAIMAIIQPMAVSAADTEVYVSEVIIETGKTESEAKAKLTDNGYTVFDKNISNTGSSDEECGYMYIGYKTTDNPDESITDIRTMNMGGGYSYAEYDELINQKTEEIGVQIDNLTAAVKEYRQNYNDKKESAAFAYEMLNKFKEDDSGLLMGDYLLDTSKTRADYINLFMQCSTVVYVTLFKALAVACAGTNGKSLLDLADIDNADLEGELQYEKTASDIYANLPVVQTLLAPYALSGVTTADGATPEDIDAKYNEMTDEEKATWNDAFAFAYILESIPLSDGSTLYDLVMTDLDELVTEDLYAFASVFSEGQAALIRTAGLKDVITVSVLDESQWGNMDENLVQVDEPYSVYTGVDRSLFEGGVALKNKAMVEAAANADKEWFGSELNNDTEEIFFRIIQISFFAATGAATTYLASIGMFNWLSSSISKLVLTQDYCNGINWGGKWAVEWVFKKTAMEITQTVMLYVSQIMTYATWVAIGVLLVAIAIFLFCDGYAYYHATYDEIPRLLVDKTVDENGESIYINYYSVKNLNGNIIDINQHKASRWVTLYTTKDKNAGKPILADFAFSDKNIKDGYLGLCRFSEDAAFNINKYSSNFYERILRDGKEDYDEIGNLYLYFKRSETAESKTESQNNFGSIFTSGSIVIGVAGILIGAIGGFLVGRKKKTKEESAS